MFPVAAITFLEGLRSRVLYGIFVFSLFAMFMSIVFSNFFMQQIGKVAIDFNLGAISFAGILISLSISVNLIYKDLDKKTVYFVISRPVNRTQYIVGKYIGLMMVVFFSFLILTSISCLTIIYIEGNFGEYFSEFSWTAYFQAIYFDFIKYSVFNSVIIFFGTICSSSFLTMLFSLSIYVVGQTITDVVNFLSVGGPGEEIDPFIHKTIHLVKYVVPNFGVFDFKVISSHGILLTFKEFLFFSGYGLVYVFAMLFFAAMIFNRKEIL